MADIRVHIVDDDQAVGNVLGRFPPSDGWAVKYVKKVEHATVDLSPNGTNQTVHPNKWVVVIAAD